MFQANKLENICPTAIQLQAVNKDKGTDKQPVRRVVLGEEPRLSGLQGVTGSSSSDHKNALWVMDAHTVEV